MFDLIFEIIEYGSTDYSRAVSLREEILRKPLGLTFLPKELEYEKDHIHIVGFIEDDICATAVLVPEGDVCKMQRVVVKADIQAKGIGSTMMKFCEEIAQANGFKAIYCHARNTAVSFYLKNKYLPEGDYFDEDSIPHLKMRKILVP